jgi:hypothetical protein
LQRKIIFDIQFNSYSRKWQTTRCKLEDKYFETSVIRQDTVNCYLMSGFVSAHIPWTVLSNLELWRPHKALHDDLVLPSATTLSNICQRE